MVGAEKRYNLLLHTDLDGTSKLAADGYYKPDSSYVDMHSTLNDLSLTYFEPFLSSVATKTSGAINGNIRLYGPLDKLVLTVRIVTLKISICVGLHKSSIHSKRSY